MLENFTNKILAKIVGKTVVTNIDLTKIRGLSWAYKNKHIILNKGLENG